MNLGRGERSHCLELSDRTPLSLQTKHIWIIGGAIPSAFSIFSCNGTARFECCSYANQWGVLVVIGD